MVKQQVIFLFMSNLPSTASSSERVPVFAFGNSRTLFSSRRLLQVSTTPMRCQMQLFLRNDAATEPRRVTR